jgi:hypothetical protein
MFNQLLSLSGESHVRNLFLKLKLAFISSFLLLGSSVAFAQAGLTMCGTSSNTQGKFALCAASTCVATGTTMDVNINGGPQTKGGSTTKFPSALCKCPVITTQIMADNNKSTLEALAAVNEGNMQGSCDVPNPNTQVWSLFQPIGYYPQATLDPAFSYPPTGTTAGPQLCKNISGKQLGSNCFSFLCTIDPNPAANGTTTATCTCPLGEGPFGGATPPGSVFPTEAGTLTSDPTKYCYMNPVSIPLDIVRQFINYP